MTLQQDDDLPRIDFKRCLSYWREFLEIIASPVFCFLKPACSAPWVCSYLQVLLYQRFSSSFPKYEYAAWWFLRDGFYYSDLSFRKCYGATASQVSDVIKKTASGICYGTSKIVFLIFVDVGSESFGETQKLFIEIVVISGYVNTAIQPSLLLWLTRCFPLPSFWFC